MNFKEIVGKNKNSIKNIIKLITKEENEDLEQEVYIKVWQNANKYKEQGSFTSWVTTIAKNLSKDSLSEIEELLADESQKIEPLENIIPILRSSISNNQADVLSESIDIDKSSIAFVSDYKSFNSVITDLSIFASVAVPFTMIAFAKKVPPVRLWRISDAGSS